MAATIVLNKKPDKLLKDEKIAGRGIKPPKSVENEVRRSINNALKGLYEELRAFRDNVQNYPPAVASQILADMQKRWADKIVPIANNISINWLKKIDERQKNKTMAMLRNALGVEISAIFEDPAVQEGIDNMRLEAAYKITTIPYESINRVAERVYQYYRGQPMPEGRTLGEQLSKEFGILYDKAKVIARDQTNKMNGNITQLRQTGLGIEEYIWRTAKDRRVVGNPAGLYPHGNRVHGNHWEREGKVYRWDNPPEDGHPGESINCVLGDTNIMLPYGAKKLFKRRYKGIIYIITTETGACLKATPNHPVLTVNGWFPVHALNEGDNLIQATLNSDRIAEINSHELIATAEQLWDTFNKPKTRRRGSKFYFHGDGSENYIYIKNTDSLLESDVISAGFKSIKEFNLTASDMIRRRGIFSFNCRFNFRRNRFFASSNCLISFFNKTLSLFGRRFKHTVIHCLRRIADNLPVFRKNTVDNPTTNPESFGNRKDAFAIDVLRNYVFNRDVDDIMRSFFHYNKTPIVKIETKIIDDYVYNYETITGYYISNGIVNHNCRCYAEPVIDLKKLKLQYY